MASTYPEEAGFAKAYFLSSERKQKSRESGERYDLVATARGAGFPASYLRSEQARTLAEQATNLW